MKPLGKSIDFLKAFVVHFNDALNWLYKVGNLNWCV